MTHEDGKLHLKLDCSGFAYYYFQEIGKLRATQEAKDFVIRVRNISEKDFRRPFVREYFDLVKNKNSLWQSNLMPHDLAHGDLIAYKSDTPRNNHCMIVDDILKKDDDQIQIRIVDCTQKSVHQDDTRVQGQGGIGRGEVTLIKDKSGWNTFKWNLRAQTGLIKYVRVRD